MLRYSQSSENLASAQGPTIVDQACLDPSNTVERSHSADNNTGITTKRLGGGWKKVVGATRILVGILGLTAMIGTTQAQTIVNGSISGIWTTSGNPYIISANANVPGGQSLTIQPGVVVWIGQDVSLTVNGAISAVGTPLQHIVFKAPTGSQYFSTVSVNNSFTNVFNYCDFANGANTLSFVGTGGSNQVNNCTFTNVLGTALAFNNQSGNQILFSSFRSVSNAITMKVNGNFWTLYANIGDCTFSDCSGNAILGTCDGTSYSDFWGYHIRSGTLISTLNNCEFQSVNNACTIVLSECETGYGNLQIQGNVFNHITNSAIALTRNGNVSLSQAAVINNIILNANDGIVSQDPWDTTVIDNIVVGCTNAVTATGALTRNVAYNDFYSNRTNFTGYTSVYGTIIMANRNGTPCDLLFNIYSNPLFVLSNNFALQPNSPCIDAGSPNVAYMDVSFPPSQGTGYPDLGILGGPLAVNWLPNIPPSSAPVVLLISKALKLTCTNVVASGTYQLQASMNLTSWTNYGPQVYITTTSNLVQYVDVTNKLNFFRLQRLP